MDDPSDEKAPYISWDFYSEIDRELYDLDCKTLNDCHLGIIPETMSIEDLDLCIG